MHRPEYFDTIVDFTRSVGIDVELRSLDGVETFLPGILISKGGLVVDRERCYASGDVLHEAGHLAVLPSSVRGLADGDLAKCMEGADLPDDPLVAMGVESGEWMATAWAYAALTHLKLPPDTVFCPGGYRVQGNQEPQGLVDTLRFGAFGGIGFLARAGMTDMAPLYEFGVPTTVDCPYPNLRRWLVD